MDIRQRDPLIPFAAGNFVYIAAADLVPEVKQHASAMANVVHFLMFSAGAGMMYLAAAFT